MRGWHSRGYLPHFDGGEIWQFITLHLADAVPGEVIAGWRRKLAFEKEESKQKILSRHIEKYADQGNGECYLKQAAVAELVQNSLLYFDAQRYRLGAWTIMPNHVHFLLRPAGNRRLEDLIHSLKSYSATSANRLLNRTGKLWQNEYFDRYIRNYEHYEKTVRYIEMNPVKAGLCEKPADWKFSSAYSELPR